MGKLNIDALYSVGHRNFYNYFCSTDCLIWDECGGSSSAPCRCFNSGRPPDQSCAGCDNDLCLDWKITNGSEVVDSFMAQYESGLPLRKLSIHQNPANRNLPLLIPAKTFEVPESIQFNLRWAAIDAEYLFSEHKATPAKLRQYLESPNSTRIRSRINSDCNLIAVLNGQDDVLEGFWGATSRRNMFRTMEKCGFSIATGPTFSIRSEREDVAASRNVCMLLRHNKVVEEISKTAIEPVPNVYWRNQENIDQWVGWINRQEDLMLISRDFSRTKQDPSFSVELEGFLDVLSRINKRVHVLVVGVGARKAKTVLLKLNEIGCTCSFVTSNPIFKGINGGNELIVIGDDVKWQKAPMSKSRPELALSNLIQLENFLIDLASELPIYRRLVLENSLRNTIAA